MESPRPRSQVILLTKYINERMLCRGVSLRKFLRVTRYVIVFSALTGFLCCMYFVCHTDKSALNSKDVIIDLCLSKEGRCD